MGKNKERLRRDQAGVGPDPDNARRHGLVRMNELDGYRIVDGEPDIRGWDVRTLSGTEVGEIEELLVDPDRGEVVMIEVEMRETGVHAEVPIRAVQLDRERKAVIVDSGDLNARRDERARDDMAAIDRDGLRDRDAIDRTPERGIVDRTPDRSRNVSYGADVARAARSDDADEVVIERRPVIEEVVVRRRTIDEE